MHMVWYLTRALQEPIIAHMLNVAYILNTLVDISYAVYT